MLKIWHYLNYKGNFYLCIQWKKNAFLDTYRCFGSFRRFRRVLTCHCNNWALSSTAASTSCLWKCFYHNKCYINVMNFIDSHMHCIAVSLARKWEVSGLSRACIRGKMLN